MSSILRTDRLIINELQPSDAAFIYDLLNTAGWLQFIGDRNIHTISDAEKYIEKINNSEDSLYHVVRLRENLTAIGVISLIKRNYLDHHDIGFAFLPTYAKKGFAGEASKTVITELQKNPAYQTLLAIVQKNNSHSIQLLERLGFFQEKEIAVENNFLWLYKITAVDPHQ